MPPPPTQYDVQLHQPNGASHAEANINAPQHNGGHRPGHNSLAHAIAHGTQLATRKVPGGRWQQREAIVRMTGLVSVSRLVHEVGCDSMFLRGHVHNRCLIDEWATAGSARDAQQTAPLSHATAERAYCSIIGDSLGNIARPHNWQVCKRVDGHLTTLEGFNAVADFLVLFLQDKASSAAAACQRSTGHHM